MKRQCSRCLSTSTERRKADRLKQSRPYSLEYISWEKYGAAQRLSEFWDCATADGSFAVSEMSNSMCCSVPCVLLLPHSSRARLFQLLFSQSTPLLPAQQLTRWQSLLLQETVVPTQDSLLNLWPTHLNLTRRTRRPMPAWGNHRMGRWLICITSEL